MTPALVLYLFALQAPAAAEQPPPVCTGLSFVYFATGSVALDHNAVMTLGNFVELLGRSTVPSRVRLTGNADRVGSANTNLSLSRRRADAVRRLLLARGVAPSRVDIVASGEGASRFAETADEIAEPLNRVVMLEELVDPAEWERREAVWARIGRPQIVC